MLVREWAWIAYYVALVFSMRAMMGIKRRLRLSVVFTEIGKLRVSW